MTPTTARQKYLHPALQGPMDSHGWITTGVSRLIMYTVGFMDKFNHPELAIHGQLPPKVAHQFFNIAAFLLGQGKTFTDTTKTSDDFSDFPSAFRIIHPANFKNWFAIAAGYNGPDNKMIQLVWPNRMGQFPWEPGGHKATHQIIFDTDQSAIYPQNDHRNCRNCGCAVCEYEAMAADIQ